MARIANSMLGDFAGKVGNLVLTRWKDISVARSKGRSSQKPPTQSQLEQREKFRLVINFISDMTELLNVTYKQFSSKMSARNHALANIIQNAVTGTFPNFIIDYSKVSLSSGRKLPVEAATIAATNPEAVNFSWTNSTGLGAAKDDDKAILVAHCPELRYSAYTIDGPQRGDMAGVLNVPFFKGKLVHAWIIFINAKGDVSASTYAGSVSVL